MFPSFEKELQETFREKKNVHELCVYCMRRIPKLLPFISPGENKKLKVILLCSCGSKSLLSLSDFLTFDVRKVAAEEEEQSHEEEEEEEEKKKKNLERKKLERKKLEKENLEMKNLEKENLEDKKISEEKVRKEKVSEEEKIKEENISSIKDENLVLNTENLNNKNEKNFFIKKNSEKIGKNFLYKKNDFIYKKDEGKKRCQICFNDIPPLFFFPSLNFWLCKNCKKKKKKKKIFFSFELVLISYCKKHSIRKNKYYCPTCKSGLCSKCIKTHTKEHNIYSNENFFFFLQKKIKNFCFDEIEQIFFGGEKALEGLKAVVDSKRKEVEKAFDLALSENIQIPKKIQNLKMSNFKLNMELYYFIRFLYECIVICGSSGDFRLVENLESFCNFNEKFKLENFRDIRDKINIEKNIYEFLNEDFLIKNENIVYLNNYICIEEKNNKKISHISNFLGEFYIIFYCSGCPEIFDGKNLSIVEENEVVEIYTESGKNSKKNQREKNPHFLSLQLNQNKQRNNINKNKIKINNDNLNESINNINISDNNSINTVQSEKTSINSNIPITSNINKSTNNKNANSNLNNQDQPSDLIQRKRNKTVCMWKTGDKSNIYNLHKKDNNVEGDIIRDNNSVYSEDESEEKKDINRNNSRDNIIYSNNTLFSLSTASICLSRAVSPNMSTLIFSVGKDILIYQAWEGKSNGKENFEKYSVENDINKSNNNNENINTTNDNISTNSNPSNFDDPDSLTTLKISSSSFFSQPKILIKKIKTFSCHKDKIVLMRLLNKNRLCSFSEDKLFCLFDLTTMTRIFHLALNDKVFCFNNSINDNIILFSSFKTIGTIDLCLKMNKEELLHEDDIIYVFQNSEGKIVSFGRDATVKLSGDSPLKAYKMYKINEKIINVFEISSEILGVLGEENIIILNAFNLGIIKCINVLNINKYVNIYNCCYEGNKYAIVDDENCIRILDKTITKINSLSRTVVTIYD